MALILKLYRLALRPLLPRCCRFVPSCSEFASLAIDKYGPWRGSLLAARRLLCCHPFHSGGFDPVP